MPPRTDFLTKQRQQIEARLKELQPAHEEYLTLLEARDALAGVKPANGRRRGPGRPPGSGRKKTTARKKTRRRRRGGTRAEQALTLIKQNPGITVTDIAKRMGIRQNYLYRVTGELQKDRKVRRRGSGFHAA
jgi:hypothetical protein